MEKDWNLVSGEEAWFGQPLNEDTFACGHLVLTKNNETHLYHDCQTSLSFSLTSAHSCDKSETLGSENTVSLLAVTWMSILEMLIGSGCQLFNAE